MKRLKRFRQWLRQHLPVSRRAFEKEIRGLKEQNRQLILQQQELSKSVQALNEGIRKLSWLETEQKKNIAALKNFIRKEMVRRDGWKKKDAETAWLAQGKPVWVIKCPAPEGSGRIRWGDYHYALALQKALNRNGVCAIVDTREDWDSDVRANVTLALRGKFPYHPDRRNPAGIAILWNISHPDLVPDEEYELYDVVCVASRHYARQLAERIRTPVFPLLQCTDTELFYPREDGSKEKQYEYLFVGNSRGIARNCVMWAVADRLPLCIIGSDWEEFLGSDMDYVSLPFVENDRLPDLYRSAKVTLNDHWDDMLEKQFINNRIFDALACGLPVISDYFDELYEVFGDAVLYYRNKEEFDACVEKIRADYDTVRQNVLARQDLIREQYSFETRARELLEIAERFRQEKA